MIAAFIALVAMAQGCYQPPIISPVVDPFRAPACAYCPGNRGLEYEPPPGSRVVAASAGVVTFSVVAGVRYVVVAQSDGHTATYGRLATGSVHAGASVAMGDVVGTTTDHFFFGLRTGDQYIDPAPFLGVLRYRPRLVPVDGSAPRRPPPPTIVCAAARVGDRASRR